MQRPMHDDIPVALGLAAPFFRVVDLMTVKGKGREPKEAKRGLSKVPDMRSYKLSDLTILAGWVPLWSS